ncbi:MAG: tripartite tricarboxylate transporter TctB family protein [Candidatus Methylomirabilia bacterium]
MRNADALRRSLPYIIVLFASAYVYWLSTGFDFMARTGQLGPDIWPKSIIILAIAACLYQIVKEVLFSKRGDANEAAKATTSGEDSPDIPTRTYPGRLITGMIMTVAYVSLVGTLGFVICTFLYIGLFIYLGRYTRVGVILANSVAGTLLLSFIFMKVVYVSLPMGIAPFSTISSYLLKVIGIR